MYKKIMVPLDGSKIAECVLPHIKAFINGLNISDISLVRVQEPVHPDLRVYDNITDKEFIRQAQKIFKDAEKQEKALAEAYLNHISDHLQPNGANLHLAVLIGDGYGDAAKTLADYADSNDMDLIIMASHGHSGIKRWIMGSVADKLFRSVSVPVFMVRAPEIAE